MLLNHNLVQIDKKLKSVQQARQSRNKASVSFCNIYWVILNSLSILQFITQIPQELKSEAFPEYF